MAMTRARASVIIFSWTAGVMYSTLFTMPYLLVAHYHSEATVSHISGVGKCCMISMFSNFRFDFVVRSGCGR